MMTTTISTFTIVYIPSDEHKTIEEWSVDLPQNKEDQVGCLTARLKQHFQQSTGSASKTDERHILAQQLQEQVIQQVGRTTKSFKFVSYQKERM